MDANNLLLLFVDDVLIFGRRGNSLSKLKHQLSKSYDMTDLVSVQQFLGMQILRNRASRSIHICQTTYNNKILSKFGMDQCNGISTSMEQSPLQNNDSIASPDAQHYYQSVTGSLMHAMLETQPDLAYIVSTLSKFNINLGDRHIMAAK
jgi:hypothetical protein